ncbi:serine/threonine-protein kinase [Pseudonocardia thermophila]|jgi:Serine/threonine protein kinase|uniref:serine/threonine-protein kinase n=1 Tax=Pseudonocardia thermophila TaxID=1848 RepID=UPI00248E6020|nr:serine/threonine-protein kinase [Pseudonocardia thermophila]
MTEQRERDATIVADRYLLGELLGRGSFAEVRKARDLRTGEMVAVKVYRAEGSVQDRARQRRELALLGRLRHPALVGMRDSGVTDGRPFVVTDLVEGPTLSQRIREGALPPAEVRRIGAQLAAGLAHVHAAGIVHRDVKPANVLLGDGSQARLADFGIAVAIDGTVATDEGCVVGTVAYLSPEQARGQQVGPPTDVWSLGLVLLEALTGRREYPGPAPEAAMARLFRRPEVPPGLPADLAAILRSMTDPDPARRPSAATVARLLAGSSRTGTGAHRRAPRRRIGARWRALLGVATVLLAGSAAVVVAVSPGSSEAPAAVLDLPALDLPALDLPALDVPTVQD